MTDMRRDDNRLAEWLTHNQVGIIILPWMVTALNVLSLKYTLLCDGGFSQSAASLRHSGILTFHEKLSLFRSDFEYCFILVPLALFFLTSIFPHRWKVPFNSAFSLVLAVIVNVEISVYNTTFAFTSLKVIWSLLTWAIKSHDLAILSLSSQNQIQIVIWGSALGLATTIAVIASRRNIRWVNNASLAMFLIVGTTATVASIPRVPVMAWTQSLLRQTVEEAFLVRNTNAEIQSSSVTELLHIYRKTDHIPPAIPTGFAGRAKNYNVIFFVMESMSAKAFDPAHDSLLDMPNFKFLSEHSFLMGRHYTSYPFTNCAIFSMFTSLYTKIPLGVEIGDGEIKVPSLIRSLRDTGYKTSYYGYVWDASVARDDRLLKSIGFEQIVAPQIDPGIDSEGKETFYGSLKYVEGNDLQALHFLVNDIHRWTNERQRFAVAYFPEIGHDPYREFAGHRSRTFIERGRALAIRQDAWMGALDNTIIVVTGDHGMRTLPIDESQPVQQVVAHGRLNDVTMRVPMLIYVPQVLQRSITIEIPTSHIDLAPTVLDLLGVKGNQELEQGSSVINTGIATRRLFLPMDKFGASGFYYNGNYYMQSSSTTVYKNSTLNFVDGNALPYEGKEAGEVRGVLKDQDALQNSLLSHLLGRSSLPY
jgi:phosphoglycerol transferase MdoB-like AlkP superfamily enzyme